MITGKERSISLLLLLALSASLFACGSEQDKDLDSTKYENTTTETETPEISTDIPKDLNFGGAECRIFCFDSGSFNTQLLAESENGEVLNDAIYRRNIKVEDTLGVKLVEVRETEWNTAYETARKILATGEDEYEIMFNADRNALTFAQEGYIEPIENLPYVDLSREYWSQSLNDDISIGGKLYFSYGDFNLTGYEATNVLLVNKKIVDDYDLDDPYESVLDGSWTLDLFASNMKKVASDLNGDNVYDDKDMYGITSHPKQVLPCFWIASGLKTIEKDSDDYPTYALPGNEKFATFYDKIMTIMYSDNVYYNSSSMTNYANNTLFINGQSLYNIVRVTFMTYYRDMDYDFGIIPYPKYDEEQEEYYSRFEGGAVSYVPIVSTHKDMAGAVMELMACESMKSVIPIYYETVLKNKYARDEKSIEMLDIIYSNRICDFGDTFWTDTIRDAVMHPKFVANDRNLQSTIEQMRPNVEAVIEAAVEAFEAIK